MNRLNKIILSFVLPFFCLLISVSYAEISANINYKNNNYNTNYTGIVPNTVYTILKNYETEPSNTSYEIAINDYLETITEPYIFYVSTNGNYNIAIARNSSDIAVTQSGSNYYVGGLINPAPSSNTVCIEVYSSYSSKKSYIAYSGPTIRNGYTSVLPISEIISSSVDLPLLVNNSGNSIWDGESYYYKVPSSEDPDSPSLPSNAEIASAVQAFYNSDYYKNNKDFSDFLVMYTPSKGNYTFIGHTLGSTLGQVIIPPNYRYQGKLYDQQWWKFYITEDAGATPYGTSYYLYNINNTAMDTVTDEGVGKISELVNIDFSSSSVIIYSTTDYPVRTYVLDENTGDYTYTDGIIEGDQYTYDENLDPTQSGYNPLDNFVTVNPSDTIVNNADFGDLSNSFEEHKDIFSFTENMQWLISANNKLSNYFLGFIVMCALFITLGRVLKG